LPTTRIILGVGAISEWPLETLFIVNGFD